MRERRLALHMTQRDVADLMGVTRAYVSAVERGVDWDPDVDKLVAWARALGLPEGTWLERLDRLPVAVLSPAVTRAIVDLIESEIQTTFEGLRSAHVAKARRE